MNSFQHAPASEQTFAQFLLHNRRNRIILYMAAAAIIIQFAVFKYLYPFANYIHGDSFAYLDAASQNLTINTYPIGYSKFLRLVSVFAKPDLVLVSLQYLMIQCSTLFLLFTLFYFYRAGRVTQAVLLCFMVFNPLALHLGNMVSSDGVFLALSMTWFALLLWIIFKPSNRIICWHAIVLFAAFTVRYNAMIYPFIALVAFALSKLSLRKKALGFGFGLLLCGCFVGLSMLQYKKLTGYWQYTPFSGWQLANNAMYVYHEVDSANREPVPAKFRVLDSMIRNFYDNTPVLPGGEASTAYMWTPWFPLGQYRDGLFAKDTSATKFKKWAGMGPFYSSYGMYFIKKYPMHFLRYFAWPNSKKYLAPPLEFLEYYNMNHPTVRPTAVKWFGYTNNQVNTRMKSGKIWVLLPYPYLISITNLIMVLMLLAFLLLKGWQYSTTFNKSILLAGFVWIANAGFTIFSASAALRFQAFPALLSATFSLLLIDWMARLVQHLKLQNQQQSLAI
ncbi:hypothetical protein [Niastella populi]|uniref:Glycosyltransferase RgtA/B/C/D-like domain-containing protein n=1 Tax=Niastella populi TaxID=550983 RepID=A0A1V9GCA3_9BACT|nr:hypothetical protein [Niastella populi]OQP68243.1 hypothetical protein A4R26_00060 [Niastella populi]